jgi:hypothetical protein
MGEYLCAPIEGVDPVFVPHMILGAMAVRYMKAVPGLSIDEAYDAAKATWDTDWETEGPRTFAMAEEEVDSDLQHWDED